jgi:hypothetical protein
MRHLIKIKIIPRDACASRFHREHIVIKDINICDGRLDIFIGATEGNRRELGILCWAGFDPGRLNIQREKEMVFDVVISIV